MFGLNKFMLCLCVLISSKALYGLETYPSHDKFIVTPIPKCGTHLMVKCLKLMTDKNVIDVLNHSDEGFLQSLEYAEANNAILKCYQFSERKAFLLKNSGYKNIFVCRDPRDACISLIMYMDKLKGKGTKRDFFHVSDNWDLLSFDSKLYAVITGKKCQPYLKEWYEHLANWTKYSNTLVVKFEDLLGQPGGGTNTLQLETLKKIVAFTNMSISLEEIQNVASQLYSPTSDPQVKKGRAFRPGSIGNWKSFFNKKHIKAFKKRYNHILIKFGYEKSARW